MLGRGAAAQWAVYRIKTRNKTQQEASSSKVSYSLINIHVYKYSSGNLHRLYVLDAESNKFNSVDLSQVYCRCSYRFCPARMGERMPKQYKALAFFTFIAPLYSFTAHFCFCAKLHGDVRHKAIEHFLWDMLLVKCYQQTSSERFKYWDSSNLTVPVQRESISQCCSAVLTLQTPTCFIQHQPVTLNGGVVVLTWREKSTVPHAALTVSTCQQVT